MDKPDFTEVVKGLRVIAACRLCDFSEDATQALQSAYEQGRSDEREHIINSLTAQQEYFIGRIADSNTKSAKNRFRALADSRGVAVHFIRNLGDSSE